MAKKGIFFITEMMHVFQVDCVIRNLSPCVKRRGRAFDSQANDKNLLQITMCKQILLSGLATELLTLRMQV